MESNKSLFHQGAENFWTIPEYGEILFWGDKSLGDYEKELETLHNIPTPSVYRYPRCRQFKQVMGSVYLMSSVPFFRFQLILVCVILSTDDRWILC